MRDDVIAAVHLIDAFEHESLTRGVALTLIPGAIEWEEPVKMPHTLEGVTQYERQLVLARELIELRERLGGQPPDRRTSSRGVSTMKVIGTGNPEVLTLRLREREVAGLKEDLGHRASVADDLEATLQERGFGAPIGDDGRTSAEILTAITSLLDRLATAQPNEQGRVIVSGPTWILGPAIRGATAEAPEQLVTALERFISSEGCTPVEVRDAVSAASAWSETLIGYDHVQNGDRRRLIVPRWRPTGAGTSSR